MSQKAGWIVLLVLVFVTGMLLGRVQLGDRTRAGRVEAPETAIEPAREKEPYAVDVEVEGRKEVEVPPPAPAPVEKTEVVAGPAPPSGFATGRVQLEGAGQFADAKVVLTGTRLDPEGKSVPFEVNVQPDANGEFSFDRLEPGRYEIFATHPDYCPRKFAFELDDEEGAGPFQVILKPGGALRVLVLGAGGTTLAGERITVSGQDSLFGVKREGETDVLGVCRIEHLTPGRYEVSRPKEIVREHTTAEGKTFRSREQHGATQFVTVEPGVEVEVVFKASCAIRGLVTRPNGAPLAGAIVTLWPADMTKEGIRMVKTYTDSAGGYELSGIAPAEYRVKLQVVGKESWAVDTGSVTLEDGQTLDHPITVQPTTLSGRVTRADTGEPLSSRAVQITAQPVEVEKGKVKKRLGTSAMAFADKDGRYRFVGLAPGWVQMWIASHNPSFSDEWRLVDFRGGGDLRNIDFALKKRLLGTLHLKILEPDGSPATGLGFSITTDRGSSRTLHGKQVGDGEYEFEMEVGSREVHAYRRGFGKRFTVEIVEGETASHTIQLEDWRKK